MARHVAMSPCIILRALHLRRSLCSKSVASPTGIFVDAERRICRAFFERKRWLSTIGLTRKTTSGGLPAVIRSPPCGFIIFNCSGR